MGPQWRGQPKGGPENARWQPTGESGKVPTQHSVPRRTKFPDEPPIDEHEFEKLQEDLAAAKRQSEKDASENPSERIPENKSQIH